MERFKKEISESPCFDKLRKIHPNFDEIIDRIVHPIAGDLVYFIKIILITNIVKTQSCFISRR